jgi:hypothetical protein
LSNLVRHYCGGLVVRDRNDDAGLNCLHCGARFTLFDLQFASDLTANQNDVAVMERSGELHGKWPVGVDGQVCEAHGWGGEVCVC